MSQFLRTLPRYQSHKQVSALKIKAVIPNQRGFELHFEDQRFAPHEVSEEWVKKHQPDPGGYFVVYEDGYFSWSPAHAFESGYELIETADGAAPSMDFGGALRALKAGKRVARMGWNGKGMWLGLVEGYHYNPDKGRATVFALGCKKLPWIGMKTADECFVPWLASQTDLLADDWCVVE